jgi:hypothetical protein
VARSTAWVLTTRSEKNTCFCTRRFLSWCPRFSHLQGVAPAIAAPVLGSTELAGMRWAALRRIIDTGGGAKSSLAPFGGRKLRSGLLVRRLHPLGGGGERVDLEGSHGRWKPPCLQTAHMTK